MEEEGRAAPDPPALSMKTVRISEANNFIIPSSYAAAELQGFCFDIAEEGSTAGSSVSTAAATLALDKHASGAASPSSPGGVPYDGALQDYIWRGAARHRVVPSSTSPPRPSPTYAATAPRRWLAQVGARDGETVGTVPNGRTSLQAEEGESGCCEAQQTLEYVKRNSEVQLYSAKQDSKNKDAQIKTMEETIRSLSKEQGQRLGHSESPRVAP